MQLPSLVLAMAMATAVMAQVPDIASLLTATPDLSNLTTLVTGQKGLLDTLAKAKDITILAPTNEAFATFLASSSGAKYKNDPAALVALLEYHVLKGVLPASAFTSTPVFVHTLSENTTVPSTTGGQVVEGVLKGDVVEIISGELAVSKVTKADIKFTGGIVHIIDKVLTLPESGPITTNDLGYTSINTALEAAGLVDALKSQSDSTLFAPTNAAFEAVSSVTSKLSKEELASILELHATSKTYYSTDLKDGASIPTLNGEDLKISIVDGTVFVDKAKVLVPNLITVNGVVHIIDRVLIPTSSGNSSTSSPTSSPSASGTGSPNSPTSSPIVPFTSAASSLLLGSSSLGAAVVAIITAATGAWLN